MRIPISIHPLTDEQRRNAEMVATASSLAQELAFNWPVGADAAARHLGSQISISSDRLEGSANVFGSLPGRVMGEHEELPADVLFCMSMIDKLPDDVDAAIDTGTLGRPAPIVRFAAAVATMLLALAGIAQVSK